MNETTQKGITALRSGDRSAARSLLTQAIEQDPDDAAAWLWLTGAIDGDEERIECLKQVLRIDPNSQPAARGLSQLLSRKAQAAPVVENAPPPTPPAAQAPADIVESPPVEEQPVPTQASVSEAAQSPDEPPVATASVLEVEETSPAGESQPAPSFGAWVYEVPPLKQDRAAADPAPVIPEVIQPEVLQEIPVEAPAPETSEPISEPALPPVPEKTEVHTGGPIPAAPYARKAQSRIYSEGTQVIFRTRPSIVPALVGFWVFLIGTVAVAVLLRSASWLAIGLSVGLGLLLMLIVAYALIRNFAVRYELTNTHMLIRFRGKRVRVPVSDITSAKCRQTFFQRVLGTGDVLIKAIVNQELASLRLRNIPECKRRVEQIQSAVNVGGGVDIRD